jgi:hypothetical protein
LPDASYPPSWSTNLLFGIFICDGGEPIDLATFGVLPAANLDQFPLLFMTEAEH